MIEDGSSVTFSYVSVQNPVLPTKLQIIGTRRREAQTEKQTEEGAAKGTRKTGQENKEDKKY